MSYSRKYEKDTDTLSQYFSTLNDCVIACRKMMQFKDDPITFVRWFDKAKRIDPRATYIFLRDHYYDFSPKCEGIYRNFVIKMNKKYKKMAEKLKTNLVLAKIEFERSKLDRWEKWAPYA